MVIFTPYRFHLLVLAAFLLALAPVHAERRAAATVAAAPPQPIQVAVKVKRGESVQIPLRIYGSRSQTLEFLIRSEPKAGKLAEIKQVEPEMASVAYTPATDLSLTSDKFTYAVRSREGVSAPCEVTIQITDEPPQLISPASVDFGRLLISQKASQKLTLTNHGGGVVQGKIEAPAPCRLASASTFKLGAGQSIEVEVEFASNAAGAFNGEIQITETASDARRITTWTAEVQSTVLLQPEQLELKTTGPAPTRSATLEITNQSAQEQKLTFRADARLLFERTLTLAANAHHKLLVQTAAGDIDSIQTEIEVDLPGAKTLIPVHGAPAGPLIRTLTPAIHFATIAPGAQGVAKLELENLSASSIDFSLHPAEPFAVPAGPLSLSAHESKTIEIHFNPTQQGLFRSDLKIVTAQLSLNVPIDGRALSPTAAASQQPSPHRESPPPSAPGNQPPPAQPDQTATAETADTRPVDSAATPINGDEQVSASSLQILSVSPKRAVVQWSNNADTPPRFQAEYRAYAIEDGKLKTRWLPFPQFTVERNASSFTCTLDELDPGSVFAIRVVGMDAQNTPIGPNIHGSFTTPAEPPIFQVTPIKTLLLAFFLCLAALWRNKRRA